MPNPAGPGAAGPNTAEIAAQGAAQAQTGTQNASNGLQQQQQTAMAQVFSAFLSRFMSIASENANNG